MVILGVVISVAIALVVERARARRAAKGTAALRDDRDAAGWWEEYAAAVGVAVLVAWAIIRGTSGAGWMAIAQAFHVLPWLVPCMLPIVFHFTRQATARQRDLQVIFGVAAIAVVLSAVTVDLDDNRECFLGACDGGRAGVGHPWWWGQRDIVLQTPQTSLVLTGLAAILLVVGCAVARSHQHALLANPRECWQDQPRPRTRAQAPAPRQPPNAGRTRRTPAQANGLLAARLRRSMRRRRSDDSSDPAEAHT